LGFRITAARAVTVSFDSPRRVPGSRRELGLL